ncbi:DgyrCDS11865 [Dimorphilus gyrociliatus]|uniref:DgyrCDS11865 n=1 Tax=Dimorphilus gyrociliatus TaxID=2664684 RepID=A0A7I8W4R2_9ANNE|nr:DgyrCDS11865 [Dimorphilus gyrociliatus]
MQNIGIPRVISQRGKNSLEIEKENFEKHQLQSMTKAVNTIECPVKEKHIRSLIVGTFHEKNAIRFWNIARRMDLQGNQITCWKFCHVLHKVLREGFSPRTVRDSIHYIDWISNIGRLWSHLEDGYGKLIYHYVHLLTVKLKFHAKYEKFPGNMEIKDDEMHKMCKKDINNYFELCVDMLDYMDGILLVQKQVFSSIDMSRAASMTAHGQCRLAPLIICIQDSCPLYDYIVKLLFDLHASLPSDTLSGHRRRFQHQYEKLKEFYKKSSNLIYFKNLIKLPQLPDRAPNFLIASEITDHQKPVAIVESQPPEPEQMEGILIDTTEALANEPPPPSPAPVQKAPVPDERDVILESLRRKVKESNAEIDFTRRESEMIQESQNSRIRDLEQEVEELKMIARQTCEENEGLKNVVKSQATNEQSKQELLERLQSAEKSSRLQVEKFNKLREMYNSLTDKHADLLRQEKSLRISLHEANMAKDTLVQSTSVRAEELASKLDYVNQIESDLEKLKIENDVLTREKEDDKLNAERLKSEIEQRRSEADMLRMEINDERNKIERIKSDLNRVQNQGEQQQSFFEKEKEELNLTRDKLLNEIKINRHNLFLVVSNKSKLEIEESKTIAEHQAMTSCTSNAEFLIHIIEPTVRVVQEIKNIVRGLKHDEDSITPKIMEQFISLANQISEIIIFSKCTSNTTPIEQGEQLVFISKKCSDSAVCLLNNLLTDSVDKWNDSIDLLKEDLDKLLSLANNLVPKVEDIQKEEVVDLLNMEMSEMSAQIEAASNKIQDIMDAARAKNKGVELEVNESVLGSCTDLMLAIKILVERSKDLQDEIVEQGRGSTSAKEFYKKHHRWTEGLLSGAKAVGWAANALVDSADKVVQGQAKLEKLIVCSQEIAASTTQLVVASKVKASSGSKAMSRLSEASKGVTKATGTVVACAKSGSKRIVEESLMDYSKITLHQAKRLEMDSQVKVLELESALEKERIHFAELRKRHYQLAGESEGWDAEDINESNGSIQSN